MILVKKKRISIPVILPIDVTAHTSKMFFYQEMNKLPDDWSYEIW
jgi:hypothetical protein